eukprot:COSAG01_NODE_60_length_29981_cov_23.262533_20_plen_129_part_00
MAHPAGADRDTPGCSVLRAVSAEEARAGGQKRSAEAMRRGEGRGHLGVSWNKFAHEWIAQLIVRGRKHYLGRYKTRLDAAMAYDAAARRELGPSAKVRTFRLGWSTQVRLTLCGCSTLPHSHAVKLPR